MTTTAIANPSPDLILVRKKVERFGLYALGFGGLLPATVVFIVNCFPSLRLIPATYQTTYNLTVAFFGLICAATYFVGSAWYDKHPRLSISCLYVSGVASIVVLHFLVLTTGGSIQSCFAYHYLYIPAIVVVTFDSIREAIIASILCAVSFLMILFEFPSAWFSHFSPGDDWKIIAASHVYRWSFALLFLLQVVLLLKMHSFNVKIKKNAIIPGT